MWVWVDYSTQYRDGTAMLLNATRLKDTDDIKNVFLGGNML